MGFSSTAVAGSAVVASATITPTPVGGTVDFSATLNGTAITLPSNCTGVAVSAGVASCTFTPAAGGTLAVSASFSGDSADSSSTGTSSESISSSISTSVTMSDNAGSILQGSQLVFTAVVSAADGSTPAGSIAWTVTPHTAFADSFCTSTTFDSTTDVATCTVNTYLDNSNGGGDDGDGHDYFPGYVDASATFTPSDSGYAGSTGTDSTIKITSDALTICPTACQIPAAPGANISLTQQVTTTLPTGDVEYFWGCQSTSSDCSFAANHSTSPTITIQITGSVKITTIACEAGAPWDSGGYEGSFTCVGGPTDTLIPA